jgi:nucleoside-diphosphate-sugar epimerase
VIYGSGLVATAMRRASLEEDAVIYAAGVSNSACTDEVEFDRERSRLLQAIDIHSQSNFFLYFSTCSIDDPSNMKSHYVQHKLAMEAIVRQHSGFLVLRLPQVAGRTPNPHTLLNFLHARIARSEKFEVWRNAARNILDIEDIVSIVRVLVADERASREVINIANLESHTILDIVASMERTVGKKAVLEIKDRGSEYKINCDRIKAAIAAAGLDLGANYLDRVLNKYYA